MTLFSIKDDVAILEIDDGKANSVGYALIEAVNEGLDRASQEAKGIVIAGRPGVFSAGFDLKEMKKGPEATNALVSVGAQMLLRIFSHPQPVVTACSGHAIAAGALILLASDTRIGAEGDFTIGLNETAIGFGLPTFGQELARARLSKRHLTGAVIQSELYNPTDAKDVGYLDQVVSPDTLMEAAFSKAGQLVQFSTQAYRDNKLACRKASIEIIRDSLEQGVALS